MFMCQHCLCCSPSRDSHGPSREVVSTASSEEPSKISPPRKSTPALNTHSVDTLGKHSLSAWLAITCLGWSLLPLSEPCASLSVSVTSSGKNGRTLAC